MLAHFPHDLPWSPFDAGAVTQLCLPKGLVFQKHAAPPAYHPFVITRENGSRVHGAALTFFELVEDESICSAMASLQTMYDAERHHNNHNNTNNSSYNNSATARRPSVLSSSSSSSSSTSVVHTPVSRKLSMTTPSTLTKTTPVTPQFALNDNLSFSYNTNTSNNHQEDEDNVRSSSAANLQRLNKILVNDAKTPLSAASASQQQAGGGYNAAKDRLYVSKCICLIAHHGFNKAFARILRTLYSMAERHDLLGISLESHVHNLIYALPGPLAGHSLAFHVGCERVRVRLPSSDCVGGGGGGELPLLDYDLLTFFATLGVSNAISLYMAGLLEHQIMLYSRDYDALMLVAECLAALFYPFVWLKPYVPIVPASNLHFIEAPVPYIMGFHHRDMDKEFFRHGQRCFVDIDAGFVSVPEGVPEFADKHRLVKEIGALVADYGARLAALQAKYNNNNNKAKHPAACVTMSNGSGTSSVSVESNGSGNSSTSSSSEVK